MKPVHTRAYIDVGRKADELGLPVPNAVWIVPSNFESITSAGEATYAADYDLVVKLLRGAGLPYSLLKGDAETYPKRVQHSFEFVVLPLLIFTKGVLADNPEIISQALGILLDHFMGKLRNDPTRDQCIIKCKIVKERAGLYVSAEYEGPAEEFKDFIEGVK